MEWERDLIPEEEDVVRDVLRGLGSRGRGGGVGVWSLVVIVVAAMLELRDLGALGVEVVSSKPLSFRSCLVGEGSCAGAI